MSKWGFAAWLALAATMNAAPVQQLWEKRYNGPAAREDVFSALTVDVGGRVYVTGSSDNNVNPDPYGTVKYDTNGNQLWVARYTGPRAIDVPLGVIVDGQGYVYVTGFSHGLASGYDPDYTTIKYAPEGTELWVARYNGAGTNNQSPDNPMGMVVNALGEVYVTGTSMSPEQNMDFATIKYATNGTQLWVARYNGAAGYSDNASAIGIDGAGNIYVCGFSEREDYRETVTLLKYSPTGTQLWAAQFDTEEIYQSLRPQMKVDSSGNAHLAFTTGRGGPQDVQRLVALQYNSAGELVWRTQHRLFHPQYDTTVVAVDLDDAGNMCVAAKTAGRPYHDYLVWKISSAGQSLWTSRYNSPAGYQDMPGGMALDAQGNIYVTGTTYTDGNRYQFTTIKLRPNGQREWETTTAHSDNTGMSLSGVQVDAAGHVYVGGSVGPVGTKDYVTIKYRQLPQPGLPEITTHPADQTTPLEGSATFSVTATGEGLHYQWRHDGSSLPGATNSTLVLTNIQSEARGYYYVDVSNSSGTVASTEALLDVLLPPEIVEQPVSRQVIAGASAQFSVEVTGSEPLSFQWLKGGTAISGATNFSLVLSNVQTANAGNYTVVVTNVAGSVTSEVATLSLVPGLEQLFVSTFRQPGQSYSFPQFLRVSTDGKAHLAQTLQLPGRNEFFTAQFDTNGAVTWSARYAFGTNGGSYVRGAAMDSSNNLYVVGETPGSNNVVLLTVVKYGPTGDRLWAAVHNLTRTNGYDTVAGVAVDAAGNVYVTGSTQDDDGRLDFLTVKFDANGAEQFAVRYGLSEASYDSAVAIQVDQSGVYVFGHSHRDTVKLITLKYDHAGALLWTQVQDGGGSGQAVAMKLDATGNVIVTGSAMPQGGDTDFLTLKYAANGDLLWKAQYTGMLDGYDSPYALAVDGAGNAYVAGRSALPDESNTSLSAYPIIKYDSNGNELWVSSSIDSASEGGPDSLAVDAAGNAYLTLGKYFQESGSDFVTSKYDTNGTRLWQAISTRERYSDEYPAALALAGNGDLLVSGISYNPINELLLFRYKQSEIVGLPIITEAPRSRDVRRGASVMFSVTALGDGLAYQWFFNARAIAGATASSYSIASVAERDAGHYAVEVRNAAGAVLSATGVLSIGVPPEIVRQPRGQTVLPGTDVAFEIIATGSRPLSYQWRHNGTNIPGAFSHTLELLNVQLEDGGLYSVVVSNRAGVVTSAEVLLMVSRQASREWVSLFNPGPPATSIPFDMELDGAQNVYVAGNWWGEAPVGYLTAKFSSAGEQLWARKFSTNDFGSDASGLAVDLAGNVYTVGTAVISNGVRSVVTVKYDSNGNHLWVRHFAGPGPLPSRTDITVSSGGSIYVVGKIDNAAGVASLVTLKYDTNGTQLWSASQTLAPYSAFGICKLAADSQDGVYVVSHIWGETSGSDVLTIKYNASGTKVWQQRISDTGDQGPVDIKVDAAGDALVEAYSRNYTNRGFLTVKYRSTDGQQLWRRTFALSDNGVDEPSALEVDYTRNIYVTGKTLVQTYYDENGYYHEDEEVLTIKYSPDGQLLWVATYGAPEGGREVGTSIAWDGDNGLYITGTATDALGRKDWLTLRYDIDGNRYWSDVYRGPEGRDDEGLVVRARFGSVYVLGSTARADYDGPQLGLIRYTDVGLADVPRIETAPQGQTAVAGNNVMFSVGASGPGPLRYQWYHNGTPIIGANGSGLLLPRVEQTNAGNYAVEVSNGTGMVRSPDAWLEVVVPARITAGPQDQCIVAGSRAEFRIDYEGDGELRIRWFHNGAPLSETDNAVVIRNASLTNAGVYTVVVTNEYGSATASARLMITPQATLAWTARYNYASNYWDQPEAATVDSEGNTYIVGNNAVGSVVLKYASNGTRAWVRPAVRTNDTMFAATDLALAPDGGVYVAGWLQDSTGTNQALTLVKYSANGDRLWDVEHPNGGYIRPVDMKVDGASNIVVTAESGESPYVPSEILTLKFDSGGNNLWTTRLNYSDDTPDLPVAMAVDSAGNIYVTGYTTEPGAIEYEQVGNYLTVKYDPAGNQVWTAEHDGPGGADDRPRAIAVDGLGNVYVTGKHSHEYWVNSGTTVYFDYDFATIKYDTNGQPVWTAVYRSAPRQLDEAVDLKVDGAGHVYVLGISDHDIVTVKYNAAGQEQWVSQLDSGYNYDVAARLALDDAGNVYLTGHSGDYGDILTSRLDANGSRLWLARFDGADGNSGYSTFDYPIAIGLDAARNVYVAGGLDSSQTSRDFVVLRYSISSSPGSPVITVPPQSTNVSAGSTATLSVSATGAAPLRYQWRRDRLTLANETNATLEIADVTAADVARYSVLVYNDLDCTESVEVLLTVSMPSAVQCVHVEQTGTATRLTIAGPSACTYQVECSADMVSWHTLGTIYNSTGTCQYLDETPQAQRRFYRVAKLPY